MLKRIWKNKVTLISVAALVLLLVCVRLLEEQLFYDPFLAFFKGAFQHAKLPDFDLNKLFLGLFFRYLLNAMISVAILYVVFKDLQLVKVVSILYFVFFILLIGSFFTVLTCCEDPDLMLLFYIRRFLIQPVFLVLFLPAFYYQKKKGNK